MGYFSLVCVILIAFLGYGCAQAVVDRGIVLRGEDRIVVDGMLVKLTFEEDGSQLIIVDGSKAEGHAFSCDNMRFVTKDGVLQLGKDGYSELRNLGASHKWGKIRIGADKVVSVLDSSWPFAERN